MKVRPFQAVGFSNINLRTPYFEGALTAVSIGLAKAIAWDGEGATCLIEVNVSGTETMKEAREVARSVVSSSLTKAAVFGHDPNWGRLACAAGYAGIPFRQEDMRIALGKEAVQVHRVFCVGVPVCVGRGGEGGAG